MQIAACPCIRRCVLRSTTVSQLSTLLRRLAAAAVAAAASSRLAGVLGRGHQDGAPRAPRRALPHNVGAIGCASSECAQLCVAGAQNILLRRYESSEWANMKETCLSCVFVLVCTRPCFCTSEGSCLCVCACMCVSTRLSACVLHACLRVCLCMRALLWPDHFTEIPPLHTKFTIHNIFTFTRRTFAQLKEDAR